MPFVKLSTLEDGTLRDPPELIETEETVEETVLQSSEQTQEETQVEKTSAMEMELSLQVVQVLH
jgi:hypothetical protein